MPKTMIGNVNVWNLRLCKELVIPDGIEKIGDHWFWGSRIKSVVVPASVKEIGVGAFCNCE